MTFGALIVVLNKKKLRARGTMYTWKGLRELGRAAAGAVLAKVR